VSSLQRGFPLADRRRVDVILLEDHPKLGYKHSVVPVRPGYARNWLTTEGLAVYATEENRAKFNLPLKRQKQVSGVGSCRMARPALSLLGCSHEIFWFQNIVVDKDAEELTRMRNYLELLTKNIGRVGNLSIWLIWISGTYLWAFSPSFLQLKVIFKCPTKAGKLAKPVTS